MKEPRGVRIWRYITALLRDHGGEIVITIDNNAFLVTHVLPSGKRQHVACYDEE